MEHLCEICNMNCYNQGMYRAHKKNHVLYPFQCMVCSTNPIEQKFFRKYVEYRHHMYAWHEIVIPTYKEYLSTMDSKSAL